jgi:moderate conductance mechanosensitive channel
MGAARLGLLALLALLWWPLPAAAAEPAATAPAAGRPPVAAALPAEDLHALIEGLQDEKGRARLIRQLQALAAAERGADAAAPVEPADFVSEITRRLNAVGGELLAGAAMVLDAPLLIDWANTQIADAQARRRWGEVLLACVVVFGLGVAVEWLLRRLLARFGREPAAADEKRRGVRVLYTALGLLLELVPVGAFAAAALLALAVMLPPFSMARNGLAELVWAVITARLLMAAAKAVLVPRPAWPSTVPLSEETRNYLLIWVRRFTWWGMFGYGITAAAWWLGVPGAIHALMMKIDGLGLAVLGIVFVLQNRQAIGASIAGDAAAESGGWVRLRRHLGDTWHVLAIVYIGTVYLAYSLHNEAGSEFVLDATGATLVTLVAARLLVRLIERGSARGLAVAPDLAARFPLLEQRANRYLPIVIRLAAIGIYVLAALAVLQAWHVAAFSWFATGTGRRVGSAVLSVVLVLALALAVWEMLAAAIERNLAALDHEGAPSRARRRTLLPLLRTAMACVIVTIAGLIVLSQIGIDIAPLLAGAGVIGVAIGFGAQALIKDLITGLFILVEDQIAVGDIVDVGKEHAGVVEAISVRTIRLRDQNGIVHTVPFSEVTSVKNLTRDFAYAVARIGIAYGQDVDRVTEILRGVCDELAEDAEFGPLILDRFDYQGVDSLNEFSVVLLVRVKTLPGKQFVVGRALNRRIKDAFEQHGIAGRDPSPVILSGPGAVAPATADTPAVPREDSVAEPQRRTA